jgi:hypothetical protein
MVLEKNGDDQLDHVCARNEEALHTVEEDRDILLRIKKRKANWIGHILHMKRLLKHKLLKER